MSFLKYAAKIHKIILNVKSLYLFFYLIGTNLPLILRQPRCDSPTTYPVGL